MSRVYGERVEITARDNRPLRFVWRGRLYGILAVLEHWVVSSQWWQRNNPDTGVPPEREFWRVEASPGGNIPPAVYELRRDAGTGDWLLVRVWDLDTLFAPRRRRPTGRAER